MVSRAGPITLTGDYPALVAFTFRASVSTGIADVDAGLDIRD